MEFGLREWMILIGGLLIVVVIIDGARRMLSDRRNYIRMNVSSPLEDDAAGDGDEPEHFNPELPNGGARTIARSSEPLLGTFDLDDEVGLSRSREPAMGLLAQARSAAQACFKPRAAAPDAEAAPEPLPAAAEAGEPAVAALPADALPAAEAGARAERGAAPATPAPAKAEAAAPEGRKDTARKPEPPRAEPPRSEQRKSGPRKSGHGRSEERAPEAQAARAPEEVLVINVLARDNNGFNGADLLEVLMACDVRYGDMKIFHRHEGAQGQGRVQFSVANLVKPGTFDPETMREFYTPGVSMFLQLPGPDNPMVAFQCMAETASCLVKNLQGEMRDQDHSIVTPQTLEHYRERVRNFERRRLARSAHRSA